MKAIPKQARAKQKRKALIKAAIDEFSAFGFEVATAKSIAATAGVATGTFYQYFENKNDILQIIAQERYSTLQEHIQWFEVASIEPTQVRSASNLESVFRRVLQSIYEFHKDSPELHQVLEQRKTMDETLMQIMEEGEQVLFAQISTFVRSFNVENAEIITNNLFAMGEGIVHRHVFERPDLNSEEVLSIGAKMLVSYFKAL